MRSNVVERDNKDTAVEAYIYPGSAESAVHAWTVWNGAEFAGSSANPLPYVTQHDNPVQGVDSSSATSHAEWQARLEREVRASFDAGQRQGIQEGRHAEQEAQSAERLNGERERTGALARAIAALDEEKATFFAAAERDVVRLALAVAARVLRHEATADPLILTGSVRVALGQLMAASEVCLRVPSADFDLWTETIEHLPGLTTRPRVMADESMCTGDCAVETELGRADLGVRAQLVEIDRMFLGRGNEDTAEGASRTRENGGGL